MLNWFSNLSLKMMSLSSLLANNRLSFVGSFSFRKIQSNRCAVLIDGFWKSFASRKVVFNARSACRVRCKFFLLLVIFGKFWKSYSKTDVTMKIVAKNYPYGLILSFVRLKNVENILNRIALCATRRKLALCEHHHRNCLLFIRKEMRTSRTVNEGS